VVEFRVQGAVGDVAAGGDVEILDLDAVDHHADAAGVALAADIQPGRLGDRLAAGDGYAVPALLTADLQVRQAHGLEGRPGELVLQAFDLLQAQDVGPALGDEAGDLIGAQADRVNVPGGDTKHGISAVPAGGERPRRRAG
jgi:hypothetical protein